MVSALGKAVFESGDRMSHEVAESTILAVTPAWISAGQDLKELVSAMLQSLANLSLDPSAALLHVFITSIPKVRPLSFPMDLSCFLDAVPPWIGCLDAESIEN